MSCRRVQWGQALLIPSRELCQAKCSETQSRTLSEPLLCVVSIVVLTQECSCIRTPEHHECPQQRLCQAAASQQSAAYRILHNAVVSLPAGPLPPNPDPPLAAKPPVRNKDKAQYACWIACGRRELNNSHGKIYFAEPKCSKKPEKKTTILETLPCRCH